MSRRDELATNLAEVRARIAAATAAAGRPEGDVALVVVTKFFPASDVRLLAELGVTDVGENRHQEAEEKAAACADLALRCTTSAGCSPTRRPPWRRTPMSSSPSTA
jgi:uncharacterized pyridoxal phosphate-containing UPF0001 family protein